MLDCTFVSSRVYRRRPLSVPSGFLFALALAATLCAAPSVAQTKVRVNVDAAKPLGSLYSTSIGVSADSWDGKATDPGTLLMLQDAGVTIIHLPGDGGSSDLYHFSTDALSNPYTQDKLSYLPPALAFPNAASFIDQLGTAVVSVNYGSNLGGTGPGEPAEAAAWVAFANGSSQSTQPIGKDSKGNDWKTVGFWAGLRSASPLPSDDGYNALRIHHPNPFAIQLWTIGHAVWNNGFYGKDHAGEPDLHAPAIPTAKDYDRHRGDSRIGPGVYGAAVAAYSKAMKAVDSTIYIGASLVAPADDGFGKKWNAEVLQAACASIDFGSVSMIEGARALPPDWKTMDEADLLLNSVPRDYLALKNDLLDKYRKYCPAGHAPQLAVTNFGVVTWATMAHPMAAGLFAADSLSKLIEAGAYSIDWAPIHSNYFLDANNQAKAAYYGVMMVHTAAPRAGDTFVAADSQFPLISAHAVKRRDGSFALLLVNRDAKSPAVITVKVAGLNIGAKGTRYDYGLAANEAGAGIANAPIEGLGANFTVTVPAYSVTTLVIPAPK
jgi:hypothetical protein